MANRIYTDGASRGNPGKSSWAFVVFSHIGEELGHKSGYTAESTNNCMELTAILEALKHIAKNKDHYFKLGGATIYSDSALAVNTINQWMDGWYARGWSKSSPGPIKNLEVVKQIHHLWHNLKDVDLRLEKVPGHAGIMGNERADYFCNKAIDDGQY